MSDGAAVIAFEWSLSLMEWYRGNLPFVSNRTKGFLYIGMPKERMGLS